MKLRRNREERLRLASTFESTAIEREAFLQEYGIQSSTLDNWLRELRRSRRTDAGFSEVLVSEPDTAMGETAALQLELNHIQLRFQNLPSVQYLGALFRALS